jgi:hypothetical protein
MYSYMIDIDLPEHFGNDFIKLIPLQRVITDKMMKEGIISSYSLSSDRSKLWVIMQGVDMPDIRKKLGRFPIYKFIRFRIHSLLIHESSAIQAPQLWLN